MLQRLLLILCAVLMISACSDSTDPDDAEFAVTVEVTDASGVPVEGLRASLSPDLDGVNWPHGDLAAKPGTVIVLELPEPVTVIVDILDVSGAVVWSLTHESPAGEVRVTWDGRDDQGDQVHDGWYEARFSTLAEGETEPTEAGAFPLLLIAGSPDIYACGVTDDQGRFSVTDRTFVPAFWDVPPMQSINEEGEVTGELEITTATRLVLLDDLGNAMTHVFDAVDGPQTISLVWAP